METSILSRFRQETQKELETNILPFWMNRMTDHEHGGFYGQMTGKNVIHPTAPKSGVLNARILWTFSAAYRILKNEKYLQTAIRARLYLSNHFYDTRYGGIYWSVDYTGKPLEKKKQFYMLSFALYGLSEYYRATGEQAALQEAIDLFHLIEKYSFDKDKNGYIEALTRQWQPIADVRLSAKDANEIKTTNTHLHILEAYTNLYRIWKDPLLYRQLKNLACLFLEKIIDKETGHLLLFFRENWESKNEIISYGHEIETSWLLYEAACVLEDAEIINRVKKQLPLLVAAASEGLQPDGSLIYEYNKVTGAYDKDRHWWVQAETVLGYMNLYHITGNEAAFRQALKTWEYIQNHLVDQEPGEWFWSILPDNTPDKSQDKAGFWKCPYHNARLCLKNNINF